MSPRTLVHDRAGQAITPFGTLLVRLCDGTGALGAAFVDQEGETVDHAGDMEAYDIRVTAAEMRLVLRTLTLSNIPGWTDTEMVLIRAQKNSFAVVALPEGYALVLRLPFRCFSLSERAVSEASREICAEAGLEIPGERNSRERWSRVDVRPLAEDPRKPAAVWLAAEWRSVELLGRYHAELLGHGETGYRARFANGAEINLIREPLGRWYAEDLPEK
ncbi:MAG: hypothetical protein IPI67_35285 [Myxococcales bacterium]|nr:hypothetical protein [Myxococcales bacterium]